MRAFKRIDDRHGSGDFHPLGASLLGLADITFTGHHYGTDTNGTTITVAERATGHLDPPTSDALTEVAAYLPSLTRCRTCPGAHLTCCGPGLLGVQTC